MEGSTTRRRSPRAETAAQAAGRQPQEQAQAQQRPEPPPPYAAYAAIMGTFAGGLATAGVLARLLRRNPGEQTWLDLVTLATATFKGARTISRDEVTSFVRAPFVEGEAHHGEGEQPTGEGLRRAIGELVTCSRCVGTWVAAGLATTQTLAPRVGRLLVWTLSAAGINDFLQAGFASVTAKANVLEAQEPDSS